MTASHAAEATTSEVASRSMSPSLVDEKPPEETSPPADEAKDIVYPTGAALALIIASLCLCVFLVALDQTIIAPALGAITAAYQSVGDIVGLNQSDRSEGAN